MMALLRSATSSARASTRCASAAPAPSRCATSRRRARRRRSAASHAASGSCHARATASMLRRTSSPAASSLQPGARATSFSGPGAARRSSGGQPRRGRGRIGAEFVQGERAGEVGERPRAARHGARHRPPGRRARRGGARRPRPAPARCSGPIDGGRARAAGHPAAWRPGCATARCAAGAGRRRRRARRADRRRAAPRRALRLLPVRFPAPGLACRGRERDPRALERSRPWEP